MHGQQNVKCVCLTSINTPLSGDFTLTQQRHRSAADSIPTLFIKFPCRSLLCQHYIICKWNRGLHKSDLSSVYQARHEPGTHAPHPRFSIYTTAFFHTTNLELFLLFVLSVRNRLAAPSLLQRILSGYRVESRGGGVPLSAGALAPIITTKLRPTQPAHAVGPWDYFPDGKAAGA